MNYIDLRSDSVTQPTQEMRDAMYTAPVGDDVFGDDPTVKNLEKLCAAKVGKEAGLFVASGTMGNQLAVMAHTVRGDEIIVSSGAHLVQQPGNDRKSKEKPPAYGRRYAPGRPAGCLRYHCAGQNG